jgi:chromosome segregation ATPase
MTPELILAIVALIGAGTGLYKAWGGAKKDDLDALRSIIAEQHKRLNALEIENASLRAENTALLQSLNQLRADLSAVQAENRTLRGKIEVLERENAELAAKNGALEAASDELRGILDEYKSGQRKPRTGTSPLKGGSQ